MPRNRKTVHEPINQILNEQLTAAILNMFRNLKNSIFKKENREELSKVVKLLKKFNLKTKISEIKNSFVNFNHRLEMIEKESLSL